MKSINKSSIAKKRTLKSAIEYTESELLKGEAFFGHGTDNAWDEAVWLVLSALQRPVDQLINDANKLLNSNEIKKINYLIQKRIKNKKPLAYLTNQAWFCGLEFYVDERVIIPRSPIAECILNGFDPWLDITSAKSVLDLCTGSGCIALAIAHYFPHLSVDASDFSQDALDVAKINRKNMDLEDRVNLVYSDAFRNIAEKKYDLIVSNPPYVDLPDYRSMPKEFCHEPEMALISGNDGLFVTNQILRQAKKYLSDQGVLIVEVGNSKKHLIDKWDLPFEWIDFEYGGEGVFVLRANQLP